MLPTRLRNGAMLCVAATMLVACTTSPPAPATGEGAARPESLSLSGFALQYLQQ